ncbi:MAG: hypothetical protein GF401_17110 [Chitinivibrionales bacterium]|nr:hypothetical protein [Chitinivibrionales bacterium]
MNIRGALLILYLAAGISAQIVLPIKDSCLLEGTVMDDPAVIGWRRMSMPVAGAQVYLKKSVDIAYPMDNSGNDQLYPAPYPYYMIVDSAKTDAAGEFSFGKRTPGNYRLTVVADGYHSKNEDLYLKKDEDITIILAPEGAYGSISGNVTAAECPSNPDILAPCIIRPVSGCTVTVVLDTSLIYPVPGPVLMDDYSQNIIAPDGYYRAVTDSDGNYKIDSIPITESDQAVRVTARKSGYAPETKTTTLDNFSVSIINFSLTEAYANSATNILRNVHFTAATDKAVYTPGNEVRVMYKVKNNSQRTVTYEMGGCQYGLLVEHGQGDIVYEYPGTMFCPAYVVTRTLDPGDSLVFHFPAFNAPDQAGTFTATAWILNHDSTKVSVDFSVDTALPALSGTGLGKGKSLEELSFGTTSGTLEFSIDKAQVISIEAFLLNGKTIPLISRRYMNAGRHEISLNERVLSSKAAVFRMSGMNFSRVIRAVVVK